MARDDGGAWAALPEWRKNLIVNKEKAAKAIIANVMVVLQQSSEFSNAIGYDMMRCQAMATAALPWDSHWRRPRPWTDHDDRMLAIWLQNNQVCVGVQAAAEGVQAAAMERQYHPVLAWMAGLAWDGEPRLDEWLTRYMGVKDSPYVQAVAARWLISAVARVNVPGIKADCALVLEGPQGEGKSAALKILADEWFTDDVAALGTKDAAEQMRGVWIVELSEMDAAVRAADVAAVKSFVSRQVDRYREAYGRRVVEYPRQCVFAASTNQETWNRDETGARRWWPVRCGKLDLDGLREARDQLWAEARDRYIAGEPWWLDNRELVDVAMQEQADRNLEDPWTAAVLEETAWRTSTTVADILTILGLPRERQGVREAQRVGAILRSEGWKKRKVRIGHATVWQWFCTE